MAAARGVPEAGAVPQAPSLRDVVSPSLCLELTGLQKGESGRLCGTSLGHLGVSSVLSGLTC